MAHNDHNTCSIVMTGGETGTLHPDGRWMKAALAGSVLAFSGHAAFLISMIPGETSVVAWLPWIFPASAMVVGFGWVAFLNHWWKWKEMNPVVSEEGFSFGPPQNRKTVPWVEVLAVKSDCISMSIRGREDRVVLLFASWETVQTVCRHWRKSFVTDEAADDGKPLVLRPGWNQLLVAGLLLAGSWLAAGFLLVSGIVEGEAGASGYVGTGFWPLLIAVFGGMISRRLWRGSRCLRVTVEGVSSDDGAFTGLVSWERILSVWREPFSPTKALLNLRFCDGRTVKVDFCEKAEADRVLARWRAGVATFLKRSGEP